MHGAAWSMLGATKQIKRNIFNEQNNRKNEPKKIRHIRTVIPCYPKQRIVRIFSLAPFVCISSLSVYLCFILKVFVFCVGTCVVLLQTLMKVAEKMAFKIRISKFFTPLKVQTLLLKKIFRCQLI